MKCIGQQIGLSSKSEVPVQPIDNRFLRTVWFGSTEYNGDERYELFPYEYELQNGSNPNIGFITQLYIILAMETTCDPTYFGQWDRRTSASPVYNPDCYGFAINERVIGWPYEYQLLAESGSLYIYKHTIPINLPVQNFKLTWERGPENQPDAPDVIIAFGLEFIPTHYYQVGTNVR